MPERWTEWRARRIQNPVSRLRYLRRQGRVRATRRVLPWALAIIGASFVIVPSNVSAPAMESSASGRSGDPAAPPAVWLVEESRGRELYSNGLQVEAQGAVANQPRVESARGIVFHTSESQLAEWSEGTNQRLRLLGRGLLDYVRGEKSYHYLIDRFGQAHRVVTESDIAFHAGHSVWADSDEAYVGLNARFLGVVFESQSRPGDDAPEMTPAQRQTGRLLVEMLRSKYGIAASNCVTHAQVSVNPRNHRVGWHTDWAGGFPFEELGLSANYAIPVPAVARFGFSYDPAFFAATGARMWEGIVAAEGLLREESARRGLTVAGLRQELRRRYHELAADREKEKSP
jgi:hypothetical protein